MLAISLDEFKLILRNFLKFIKATIVPHLVILMNIDGKNPCFVAGASKKNKGKEVMLYAHQVAQAFRHGDPTFVAALLEVNVDLLCEIPTVVFDVLKEFEGVMPSGLPCELPPSEPLITKSS